MTNNNALERADIIAALRCCQTTNCLKCPCRGRAAACKYLLLGAAADLLEHFREAAKMVEPNDPLTLEELNTRREPVWCTCDSFDGEGGYWCLCRYGEITPPSCRPFMAKERPSWVFYRRKPEGGGE